MVENKRERSRLSFDGAITVGTGSKSVIAGTIRDISMNGVFILARARVAVGSDCGVTIIFEGKSSSLLIRARGVVSRHAPDGMGIRFEDDLEWWSILEEKCLESLEAKTD